MGAADRCHPSLIGPMLEVITVDSLARTLAFFAGEIELIPTRGLCVAAALRSVDPRRATPSSLQKRQDSKESVPLELVVNRRIARRIGENERSVPVVPKVNPARTTAIAYSHQPQLLINKFVD